MFEPVKSEKMTSALYLEHYLDGTTDTAFAFASPTASTIGAEHSSGVCNNVYPSFAGLEHLPNELKRNFTLMRDLDSRAQVLMKSIDEKADEYLKSLVNSKENISNEVKKEKLQGIQELFNKAKEYGDDKVQLAIQTYELVDKHIRRLDSDLARFEGEIQDKTVNAREKSEENVTKSKLRLCP